MSIIENPTHQAYLEEFITKAGKPTKKGAPYFALLTAVENKPEIYKEVPEETKEILQLLGTLKTGGSSDEMSNIIEYIQRNWIDPESLSVDEGTMAKFGGETAYTVAGETYSGDPRRKVDWAGGIPTEDKATTILDAMKMKLSDNPAYSDTTTTEEYEGLMNELKAPGLLEKFMNLFK